MELLLAFLSIRHDKIWFVASPHSVLQCSRSPDPNNDVGVGRFLDEVNEMNVFRRFAGAFVEGMERTARVRVLKVLKGMDPDFLREHGFSPELLKKGTSAWPWRLEAPPEKVGAARVDPLTLAEMRLSESIECSSVDPTALEGEDPADEHRPEVVKVAA